MSLFTKKRAKKKKLPRRNLTPESLESRLLLTKLTIFANGDPIAIPDGIGVDAGGNAVSQIRSISSDGELEIGPVAGEPLEEVTLGNFFEAWRNDEDDSNPDAVLDPTQLLGNTVDASNTIQMFVNGQVSFELDNYAIQEDDEIVLAYGENPIVALNTTFGPLVFELFEDATPGTVANFFNYVNDGDYIDTFFHRSAESGGTDFVIQGGGFSTTDIMFTSTAQFSSIPTDPPIANEPGISNLRGTIAMAKTSDPDSATSQFFVNLSDTNTFLDDPSNSGGFTVFGQVLDMTTADAIAALPVDSSNPPPYGELPVSEDGTLVVVQSIEGLGNIAGTKFADADEDGEFDAGEQGMAGAIVFIDTNNNGNLDEDERSATTDSQGRYRLQVEPGTHTIATVTPEGSVLTAPTGGSQSVSVTEIGRTESDVDFGEAGGEPDDSGGDDQNTISGVVYLDHDGDGTQDANEPGVPGSQITLAGSDTSGLALSRTTLTRNDGSYRFENVPSGTYTLMQTQPEAILDVTDDDDPLADRNQISEITVSGGQELTANDFPEAGLKAEYTSIIWFFASSGSGDDVFREIVARGEDVAGNFELATAIRVPGNENNPPVANADSFTTDQDTALTVAAADGVLSNDTDSDGDDLTANLVTSTSDGTLDFSADGSFTYSPDTAFAGTDTFTYTADDGSTTSEAATVTITVTATVDINTAPVASPDSFSLNVGETLSVTGENGVLANDSDADGDELTATVVTLPMHGSLTLAGDGAFIYAPETSFSGTDSFTYEASDGELQSEVATVTLEVISGNEGPTAVDDTFDADEDQSLTLAAGDGVLANDTDPDGDTLTAQVLSPPSRGSLSLNSDGSLIYTPEANFAGDDSFIYEVQDGAGATDQATATINIRPINDAPSASDDTYSTDEDMVLAVDAVFGLLVNDTDIEADLLSAVLANPPANGTATVAADGSFTYTPDENFHGVDSFDYVADDGSDQSAPATVTIDVAAIDDASSIGLPAEFNDPSSVASRVVGELISFAITVEDVDDSDYIFQLDLESSGIPEGESMPTIDPASGQLTWTPTSPGRFELRVIVVNGEGEANQETFEIDILPDTDGGG